MSWLDGPDYCEERFCNVCGCTERRCDENRRYELSICEPIEPWLEYMQNVHTHDLAVTTEPLKNM